MQTPVTYTLFGVWMIAFAEASKGNTEDEITNLKTIIKSLGDEVKNLRFVLHSMSEEMHEMKQIISQTPNNMEGSAYDPEDFTFYCPVSGFYFFHYSVYSDRLHNQEQCAVALYKGHEVGEQVVGTITFKQGTEDIYITASNSAFVLCEEGEPVWVKSMADGLVYGDSFGIYGTSFSGFLINILGPE